MTEGISEEINKEIERRVKEQIVIIKGVDFTEALDKALKDRNQLLEVNKELEKDRDMFRSHWKYDERLAKSFCDRLLLLRIAIQGVLKIQKDKVVQQILMDALEADNNGIEREAEYVEIAEREEFIDSTASFLLRPLQRQRDC